MAGLGFRPPMRLFMKPGCPFCTKLAVFLADSQTSKLVTFAPDDEHNRAYVQKSCGKTSFPALELEVSTRMAWPPMLRPHTHRTHTPIAPAQEGKVMLETDDIIAHLAAKENIDMSTLQNYNFFKDGMMVAFQKLFRYGCLSMISRVRVHVRMHAE